MLRRFVMLLPVLLSFTQLPAIQLEVIYPKEGAELSPGTRDSTFILGSAGPLVKYLKINQQPVRIYPGGGFLAWVPVQRGPFVFKCVAGNDGDSLTVERRVFIKPLVQTTRGDSLVIEDDMMLPRRDHRLHQGDLFRVAFKGTPGCRASFSIDGVRKNIPMSEKTPHNEFYWGDLVFGRADPAAANDIKGYYTGSYLVQPLDWREDRKVVFQLVNADGDTVRRKAPGRLTIFDNSSPQTARVIYDMSVMRTAPYCGYYYFLPKDVRLWTTGQIGPYVRVRLSDTDEAWIEKYKVQFLPEGTPPPKSIVKVVRTADLGTKTRLTVFTGERLPFRIQQSVSPQSLQIFFYGATGYTNWIRRDFADPLIRDIRWHQAGRDVYKLDIALNQKQQWGYDARYDENNHFVIDIKKSPQIAGWPKSPLNGISILLDPGHAPEPGAVGPTGFTEREANLLLAQTLEQKLASRGAAVFLTRSGDEGIYLRSRMRLAALIDADILLSLHHNAVPDGVNPLKHRGTSTYYYHPQSYLLAALLQDRLLKKLQLPDFGLYYDNLAMCRLTQMPAVLLEPAFMIHPEEEALIKSAKYRKKCSRAIVDALEDFLRQSRE